MKNFLLVLLFVGFVLLALSSPVLAGGSQNVGEIGEGATNQIGCSDQPCSYDAPQPQNQYYGEAVLEQP